MGVLWPPSVCPLPDSPTCVPWETAVIHPFGQGHVLAFTSGKTLPKEVSSGRPYQRSGQFMVIDDSPRRRKSRQCFGNPFNSSPPSLGETNHLPARAARPDTGRRRGRSEWYRAPSDAGVVAEGGGGRRTKEIKQPPSKELQNLLFQYCSFQDVIIAMGDY